MEDEANAYVKSEKLCLLQMLALFRFTLWALNSRTFLRSIARSCIEISIWTNEQMQLLMTHEQVIHSLFIEFEF